MASADTKQRILDVAEQLFADHGFAGTSLRRIISDAGVNLAAVHYHFHSKEALLEAVLIRRLQPLNQERLAELDRCERQSGRKGPAVEDILRAFIGPPVRLILNTGGTGCLFGKLIGRLHSESGAFFVAIAKRHFRPVSERFSIALQRALPGLRTEELQWRMHFAIGAMAHLLTSWDQIEAISDGRLKPGNVESTIPRLIDFISAGLRAPVAGKQRRYSGRRS